MPSVAPPDTGGRPGADAAAARVAVLLAPPEALEGVRLYRERLAADAPPLRPADLRRAAALGARWSAEEWSTYLEWRALADPLARQMGQRGSLGAALYSGAGYLAVGLAAVGALARRLLRRGRPLSVRRGPDGTLLVGGGLPMPGYGGTTYGGVLHFTGLPEGQAGRALLNHEYVHVLQVRRDGVRFLWNYLLAGWRARRRGAHTYWGNPYEVQAYAIERFLAAHPWLPDLWEMGDR